jgi:hypothetical protein
MKFPSSGKELSMLVEGMAIRGSRSPTRHNYIRFVRGFAASSDSRTIRQRLRIFADLERDRLRLISRKGESRSQA